MNVNHDNINKQSFDIAGMLQRCRICLSSSKLTGEINTVIHECLTCNDILQITLSLQLDPIDGFPENICSDCIKEIIKTYKFKQKIQDTEKYLNTLLNKNVKLENSLDVMENNIYQNFSYTDHDYFIERKPVSPKPDGEQIIKKETKDSVAKAISEYLETKLNTFSSLENFVCRKCNNQFSSEEELKAHTKKEGHILPRLYPCTVCEKMFTKSKLLVHIRVHTRERPFTCKTCNMKFTIKSNLKRHIMIHTGERPHVCDICGKGFIQGLSLTLHRKTHTEPKIPKQKDRKSREPKQQLLPTFECEICGRKFKRIVMFQAHLRKHNVSNSTADAVATIQDKSEVPRPFKCLICYQSYTSKQYLKLHQRIHGEKKYLCTVCGKGFHQTGSLQTHFRMHTGEKPYKCKICEKSFAYISSLETHMLLHTGEKPYICNVCGKAFKQSPHLRHHLRVHTGEKPHECPYCLKCFALKGNLKVHIRTHTGETPYRCETCGKGFYDSSSMKKHQRGHGDIIGGVKDIDKLL